MPPGMACRLANVTDELFTVAIWRGGKMFSVIVINSTVNVAFLLQLHIKPQSQNVCSNNGRLIGRSKRFDLPYLTNLGFKKII